MKKTINKKSIFLVFALIINSAVGISQDKENIVSLDVFGPTIQPISIHYNRIIKNQDSTSQVYLDLGYGFFPDPDFTNTHGFNFGIGSLSGKRKSKFNLGIGTSFVRGLNGFYYKSGSVEVNEVSSTVMLYGNIGYVYLGKCFVFKATVSPFLDVYEINRTFASSSVEGGVMPSVSFGFRF